MEKGLLSADAKKFLSNLRAAAKRQYKALAADEALFQKAAQTYDMMNQAFAGMSAAHQNGNAAAWKEYKDAHLSAGRALQLTLTGLKLSPDMRGTRASKKGAAKEETGNKWDKLLSPN